VLLPALAFVPLAGDLGGAVAQVPAAPGVGQVLGPEGRSLLLGMASNLRRWAGSHLGLGKPAAPGRRPKTNLAPIATAVGWVAADAPFRQRLLYERLVAPLVPLSARRDLKPPAFLHLDPAERFPRVRVVSGAEDPAGLFGPFRDRRAAEKAREAVHRLFRLRPCDFTFDPDPALPLGLGCLFAQVRSCAAPCLARVSEDEYRALAERAASWLGDPTAREQGDADVQASVAAVGDVRVVIVDCGREEIGLYPVREGRVLEDAAVLTPPSALDVAVGGLSWPKTERPDDWRWLAAWLRTAKGRAAWVVVGKGADRRALTAAVRRALPARFAASAPGDNVETAQRDA